MPLFDFLQLTPQGMAISFIPLAVAIIFAVIAMVLFITQQWVAGLFMGAICGLIIYMNYRV